jgi:diguanylate cyclase (GGDEF)-like protein
MKRLSEAGQSVLAVTPPDALRGHPKQRRLQATLPTAQDQAMRRFVLTLPSYALSLLVLYVGAWLELFPTERAHLISFVVVFGLSIFGGLIQSGRTLRWRDPLMVLPQVLFGVAVVALTYHLIDISRGIAFMWLAVIVVYDMRRLPVKQVRLVIAVATILQLANFLSIWAGNPSEPVLIDEMLNLVCLALLLPTLAMVSSQTRAWVKQRKEQNIKREQTLQTLSFLSAHDALTGLYNRRHMLESLEQEVRKTARFGMPFTVAMLDIDFFKRVNDQHGHAVGDAVLRRFSDIASSMFGPLETVARWGGEEFVILMPETDEDHAYHRLQALRTAVHKHDWGNEHPGLRVTFSAGLAVYRDGSVAQLMEVADLALYGAKHAGRDRVHPEFTSAAPHSQSDGSQSALKVKADASSKQNVVVMPFFLRQRNSAFP